MAEKCGAERHRARQRSQPREVVRAELRLREARGLRRRLLFEEHAILVARYAGNPEPHQAVGDTSRIERTVQTVAEMHNAADAATRDLRQHGIERASVSVDVGQDGHCPVLHPELLH
jgi:hypothetical protein